MLRTQTVKSYFPQVIVVERLPGPRAWPVIGNALLFILPPRGKLNTGASCGHLAGPHDRPVVDNVQLFNLSPKGKVKSGVRFKASPMSLRVPYPKFHEVWGR